MKSLRTRIAFIAALSGSAITTPSAAMQLSDPHSAAQFIQQQRALVQSCLHVARGNHQLDKIWSAAPCEALLARDRELQQAWALVLPGGSIQGLSALPYGLRQPTVDAYAEYKAFAERIAQLTP